MVETTDRIRWFPHNPHFTIHTSMLPHLRALDGHHLRSKSITCKDSHNQ